MARITWPIHWAAVSGFPSLNMVQVGFTFPPDEWPGGREFLSGVLLGCAQIDPRKALAGSFCLARWIGSCLAGPHEDFHGYAVAVGMRRGPAI
jgi:hypothetical protein